MIEAATSRRPDGRRALAAVALAAWTASGCRQVVGLADVEIESGTTDATTSSSGAGGAGGAGECGPDVSSDPHNCGACGHDCRGGACVVGKCQPVVMAKNQYIPHQIAVDPGADGDVFWTDYVSVQKMSKSGGGQYPLHYVGVELGSPRGIAVQGDTIVFAVFLDWNFEPAFVGAVDRAGDNFVELANGWVGPWLVATDAQAAYFTTRYDAHVVRVPLAGGPPTVLDPGPAAPHADAQAWSVAVDASGVFYAAEGRLFRVLPSGGPRQQISDADETDVAFVAIDEQYVYWFHDSGGGVELRRRNKDLSGPNATMLTTTIGGNMAVDATHVYWGDWQANEGAIHRWRKDDGAGVDEIVAEGYTGIGGIAIDETSVYWCNEWDKTVVRLAK